MSRRSRYCDHFIYACMMLFAFSLPVSIAVSQSALFLGIAGWAVKIALEKRLNRERTPVDPALLALLAAGVLSALFGADRLNSLAGLRTFWTLLIIYILYNNIYDCGRVKLLVSGLFAGAALFAVYSAAGNIGELAGGVEPDLIGDMTQAGQFMVICGLAGGCFLYRKDLKGRALFLLLVLVLAAAVVLEFKRGAWVGLACIFLVLGAFKSPKIIGVLLLLLISAFALFSPLRERLYGVSEEFSPESRGRLAMWRTAPEIIRDYPLGAGLDNVGPLMYRHDPSIELKEGRVKHSHLHNSYLQVLVEMGLAGLAAYIAFIAVFLKVSHNLVKAVPEKYPYEKGLAAGGFSSFTGFLVQGMFEHNFGDSEVVMIIFFIMGCVFIIDRRMRVG